MTKKIRAWWISGNESRTLRYCDDRVARVGVTHTVECKPELCEQGLHASRKLMDALRYGGSSKVYLVNVWGDVVEGYDKLCGKHREYIGYLDCEHIFRKFAREQALINIEKIRPYCSDTDYQTIVTYLKTGRGRSAAQSAARSTSESVAWSVAQSVAWSAWSAAWSAAWSVAQSAALSADGYADGYNAHIEQANQQLEKMVLSKMEIKP